MRHAADRLSVRWFLGYDLGEPLPDHSSLTKIRTRYGLEVFRRFFEAIVEQCQEAGLVWGRELYVDGTKVAANAGKESVKPRFAVEAHLRNLFDTEAEEPGDEEEQQQAAEEPTPRQWMLPRTTSYFTLHQQRTKNSSSTMQRVMTGLSKREHKIAV